MQSNLMHFFQRRIRDTARAVALDRGEPRKLVTKLDESVRVGVVHGMMDSLPGAVVTDYAFGQITWNDVEQVMGALLTRAWRRANLGGRVHDYLISPATDAEVLDAIEAWFPAIRRAVAAGAAGSSPYYSAESIVDALEDRLRAQVNDVFDDADVGYQVIGAQVVPRESMAMHADVVAPVTALTHGQSALIKVERAYQKALQEMKPGGDPSDAITDAATALQEMLGVVGAKGNSLGALLADARRRDLLGPFDSKLSAGIESIGEWVSAQRSALGDAHHVRDASRADAWLAIHVAGALILRLGA